MDISISVGGRTFLVPPLSARRIIKFSQIVIGLGTIKTSHMSEEDMTKMYEALLIGLQQAEPGLTLDAVLDMPIPMNQAFEAVKSLSKLAGLEWDTNPPAPAAAASPTPPASRVNGTGSSPTL
jgi:hypothetical protein